MKKRGWIVCFVVLMLVSVTIPASAAPEGANTQVKLVVDGEDVTAHFDEDTLWLQDGVTMAGVRALGEAVGAEVSYDTSAGSVVVTGLKAFTPLLRKMSIWWAARPGRCPRRPMR